MNRISRRQFVSLVVLSVALGFGSGVLSTALTTNYLSDYAQELQALTAPLRLSEERPRAHPETYQEAVAEVSEKVAPGLAEFYFQKGGVLAHYPAEEAVAHGIVLTSDGWIATKAPAGIDLARLVVIIQGERYFVEQFVPDRLTGAAFVKVDGTNLPVVAFGDGFSVQAGDQLFLIPSRDGLRSTAVTHMRRASDVMKSSDRVTRRIYLEADGPDRPQGIPVANLAGELIGLVEGEVAGQLTVTPLNSILPSFTSLLREGVIMRPMLGVQVVDIANSVGLSKDLSRGQENGALLFGAQAVPFNSPAAKAGLKAGDIILSVDGQPLNGRRTLDEYLLEYAVGDILALTVDRDGELVDFEVTLTAAP